MKRFYTDSGLRSSDLAPLCAALTVLCCVFLITGYALTQDVSGSPEGRVTLVIDGDTLEVSSGKQVRLTGIQAPKLPLGRTGFETWPLAAEAKAELEALSLDQPVSLQFTGERRDRYDRLLAQVYTDDGLWLQGEMIVRGFARVYSFADNASPASQLLALEREARAARRGIWALPYYDVRPPEPEKLLTDLGSFQLVEGVVQSAALVRGRTFLNFGADYKTDFTVTIAPKDLKRFSAAQVDPQSLEGKHIRVRGWLTSFKGPSMELDHPEQIELLEP